MHSQLAGAVKMDPEMDPNGLDSQEFYESGVQMLRNIAFFLTNFSKHTKPFSPLIAHDSNSQIFSSEFYKISSVLRPVVLFGS